MHSTDLEYIFQVVLCFIFLWLSVNTAKLHTIISYVSNYYFWEELTNKLENLFQTSYKI